MSQQSFRALGVSAEVEEVLAARDITSPFRIQSLVLADALAGQRRAREGADGSGKTLAFALPIVERTTPGNSPAALVLVPTRELALQVTTRSRSFATPKRLRVATSTAARRSGRRPSVRRRAHVVVATPGRLQDLIDRRMISLDRVADPHPRRGRPDARHGLQAAGREDPPRMPRERQTMLFSATLDGEVLRARARVHAEPGALRGRAAERNASRARSTTSSSRSRPTRRSRRWSRSSSATATSRSSSCAPSAAPSVSSRSSRVTT